MCSFSVCYWAAQKFVYFSQVGSAVSHGHRLLFLKNKRSIFKRAFSPTFLKSKTFLLLFTSTVFCMFLLLQITTDKLCIHLFCQELGNYTWTDCIWSVLAATDCSHDLFPIFYDYSSTLPLKCLQIWICISVSVSSSGTVRAALFASGFTMIG